MKRTALGVLFAAAAGGLAGALGSSPAWALVALGLISTLWRRDGASPGVASLARKVLHLVLLATFLFGWIVTIYPVMSADTLRLWSLVLGYTAGSIGAFFLLTESEENAWSSSVPAAAGMLVVSSFELEVGIQPYLTVAGVAGFGYLAADVVRRRRRVVFVSAYGVLVALLAASIVLLLPWTQGKVERVMMAVYAPAGAGTDARGRARLGELERLKLSKKVVMRVWSERPQRLRTGVLDRFDGTSWWSAVGGVREIAPSMLDAPDPEIRRFLDALPGEDFTAGEGRPDGERVIRTRVVRVDGRGLATPGGSLVLHAPLERALHGPAGEWLEPPNTRVRLYGVLHELDHQRAQSGPLEREARAAYLQLPESLDPRFAELALRLTASAASEQASVRAVVDHLRESYRYSLDVGRMDPRDPLADFLFEKRRGWCEYFAGAAAVLLRTRGIPTRYVRGFNVIGSQKKGDHYVVREWDRHAWIEAYVEGRGWLEYDPTPAAEYESLHAGLDDGGLTAVLEWVRARLATLYAHAWHFDVSSLARPVVWTAGIALFLFVAHRLSRSGRWRGRPRDVSRPPEPTEIERLLGELDARLAALGVGRPASRGPLEHWMGLGEEELPESLRPVGARIIELHYGARFGGLAVPSEAIAPLWHALRDGAT